MAITDSSLRNSVFLEVKNIISSASLAYYDNTDASTTGVTITSSYTDEPDNLPEVVVFNADVAKDEFVYDRSNFTNTIQVRIDVFTKKAKNLDYIVDQLDNISGLKTITGMFLTNWDETMAFSPQNENKIHSKTITLTYKRR